MPTKLCRREVPQAGTAWGRAADGPNGLQQQLRLRCHLPGRCFESACGEMAPGCVQSLVPRSTPLHS